MAARTCSSPFGPVVVPDELEFVSNLPRACSGKIMQRVVRAGELGKPVGDISAMDGETAEDVLGLLTVDESECRGHTGSCTMWICPHAHGRDQWGPCVPEGGE